MNIKTIIVGSLALASVIGGSFFKMNMQDGQAAYTPRSINNGGVRGNAGYAEYMNMLRADPATGKIDRSLVNKARSTVIERRQLSSKKASLGLNWNQMGPDNVGGRTRAILIDQDNPNIVYAGSVAGGLFVSKDATTSWNPIAAMQGLEGENLAISCITQTENGRIFFGTGNSFEGGNGGNGSSQFIGNGVYEYVPSTGAIVSVITNGGNLPNNVLNSTWTFTNAIAHKGNRLYLGTGAGMFWADPNGSGDYPQTLLGWENPLERAPGLSEDGVCQDIDIASDGSMAVCFGTKIYTSSGDASGSFTKYSFGNGSRLALAIAPSDPDIYYLVQCTGGNGGVLVDFRISRDRGENWDILIPGGSSRIDPFMQTDGEGRGQGLYDMAIGVDPNDWGHVIVGGVQLYEFNYTPGSNPIGGSWFRSANLIEYPGNTAYVHADKHTVVWGDNGVVYVGGDGGVARSPDNGVTWQARNFGYNVTTFYNVATAANGWFMGGAQDNGTQVFSYQTLGSATRKGTYEVKGGDGFDCAFSNLGSGIIFATSQEGSLTRGSYGGAQGGFYNNFLGGKESSGNEPFVTVLKNWEKANDMTSLDSIEIKIDTTGNIYANATGDTLMVGDTIFPGKVLNYESTTNNMPLTYLFQDTMVLDSFVNTLKFIDPVQNRFVVRFSDGCYLTRDAAKLNNSKTSKWFKISSKSNILNFEFTPDGSSVFLGSNDGKVYRVDGLASVNNDNTQTEWDANLSEFQIGGGLGGGSVVGLAIDPNDGNNLIATAGGYSNSDHVYRCTNALTATTTVGTFEAIQGLSTTALPYMPVFDAEIDYTSKDTVIIATEWGVWTTDNAFSALNGAGVEWSDASGNGMAHVPVFAVEQQQLSSAESENSGAIYLGTHARGFYMASDLQVVSVEEENNDLTTKNNKNSFVSNLTLYPNPLNSIGTLEFDLIDNVESTVNVYNLSGTLVQTIALGRKAKGNHKVDFNANNLSVGSYIISLESGNERSVAKFIVTR